MECEAQAQLRNMQIHSEQDPVQNLSDSTVNWSKAIHQVRSGYLPELKFTEERPYDKNDFAAHFNHSYKCLKDTLEIIRSQAILKPSLLKESKDILKNFTISAILLCGENVQSKEWNESRHIEISYQILTCLKSVFLCDSASSLFLYKYKESCDSKATDTQILHIAIKELSPKLSKTSWKNYPAAQFCFSWILHQITLPDLGAHLPNFLPFTLCFVDDWETKNKLMGLTCMDHIVKESSATELKLYGRSDLIQDALKKLLFCRKQEIVNILIPCWLRLLTKVEPCNDHAKVSSWDLLMKELLYKMEMETNFEVKHAYCKHLKTLIEALDIGCVRWMSSVLRILSSCLEAPTLRGNEEYRSDGLQTLQSILTLGKARIKIHSKTIFELLLRLLYETSKALKDNSCDIYVKLHEECANSLKFSVSHAPEEFKLLCDGMDKVEVNHYFDSVIKSIFNNLLQKEENVDAINNDSFVLCMQKP